MSDRYQTILLFGGPGAGKGTQGKILGTTPGFCHVSSGDAFRKLDRESELGKLFLEYSTRGDLVPDDVTVQMWANYMNEQTSQGLFKPDTDLLILDGIPRNVHQAEIMREYCEVLGVVHLMCRDKEEMISRLRQRAIKENRTDDAREETILNRLNVYEQETAPVLACYPAELIFEVDAIGSPASVLQDVLNVVAPIQEAHFSKTLSQG